MNSIFKDNRVRAIIFILIAGALIFYFKGSSGDARRSVAGIGEPKQEKAKGSTTLQMDDFKVDISYLYSYDIEALVVHTKNYTGGTLGDKLAPKDLALAWGKVAEYNDRIDFNWSQNGRWYYWKTDTYAELNPVGGVSGVSKCSANNHIIGANDAVRASVKKIKAGDHIRMKGYLVNINASRPDGATFYWYSSTTRDDTGDGSCEVFYVTDVTLLD